jgi:hypothetical protein
VAANSEKEFSWSFEKAERKSFLEWGTSMNPEAILWSRVLLQAIWDLAGIKLNVPKRDIPRLQRRTRAWFTARDDSPGSFIWICHNLSLEPDVVRSRVLNKPTGELGALLAIQPSTWDVGSMLNSDSVEIQEMSSEAV